MKKRKFNIEMADVIGEIIETILDILFDAV